MLTPAMRLSSNNLDHGWEPIKMHVLLSLYYIILHSLDGANILSSPAL